ncbi:Eco29kI family restriction endonuclease [Mycobacterium colombiense]
MVDFRPEHFDPLSTSGLTAIICRKFEEQPAHDLADLPPFEGAGLYAIYYAGTNEALYAPLTGRLIPVYVGSARSHDSATGASAPTASPLRNRLRDHAQSIAQGALSLTDFRVRLLLMPDVHIDLGENGLRVGYKPVWNTILRGFGNHDPGSGRPEGEQSAWDAIHAGRNRTYGREREDHKMLVALAADLIDRQVRLLGDNEGLDWSTYDPDAIKAKGLPKRSDTKAAWVDYMVEVHGVDRLIAQRTNKSDLIDRARQTFLDQYATVVADLLG